MSNKLSESIKNANSELFYNIIKNIDTDILNKRLENTLYPLQYACYLNKTEIVDSLIPLSSQYVLKSSVIYAIKNMDNVLTQKIINKIEKFTEADINIIYSIFKIDKYDNIWNNILINVLSKYKGNINLVHAAAIESGSVNWFTNNTFTTYNKININSVVEKTTLLILATHNLEILQVLLTKYKSDINLDHIVDAILTCVTIYSNKINNSAINKLLELYYDLFSGNNKSRGKIDTQIINAIINNRYTTIKNDSYTKLIKDNKIYVLSILFSNVINKDNFLDVLTDLHKIYDFDFNIKHIIDDEPLLKHILYNNKNNNNASYSIFNNPELKYTFDLNTQFSNKTDIPRDDFSDKRSTPNIYNKEQKIYGYNDDDLEHDYGHEYGSDDEYDREKNKKISINIIQIKENNILRFFAENGGNLNPITKSGMSLITSFIDASITNYDIMIKINDPYFNILFGSLIREIKENTNDDDEDQYNDYGRGTYYNTQNKSKSDNYYGRKYETEYIMLTSNSNMSIHDITENIIDYMLEKAKVIETKQQINRYFDILRVLVAYNVFSDKIDIIAQNDNVMNIMLSDVDIFEKAYNIYDINEQLLKEFISSIIKTKTVNIDEIILKILELGIDLDDSIINAIKHRKHKDNMFQNKIIELLDQRLSLTSNEKIIIDPNDDVGIIICHGSIITDSYVVLPPDIGIHVLVERGETLSFNGHYALTPEKRQLIANNSEKYHPPGSIIQDQTLIFSMQKNDYLPIPQYYDYGHGNEYGNGYDNGNDNDEDKKIIGYNKLSSDLFGIILGGECKPKKYSTYTIDGDNIITYNKNSNKMVEPFALQNCLKIKMREYALQCNDERIFFNSEIWNGFAPQEIKLSQVIRRLVDKGVSGDFILATCRTGKIWGDDMFLQACRPLVQEYSKKINPDNYNDEEIEDYFTRSNKNKMIIARRYSNTEHNVYRDFFEFYEGYRDHMFENAYLIKEEESNINKNILIWGNHRYVIPSTIFNRYKKDKTLNEKIPYAKYININGKLTRHINSNWYRYFEKNIVTHISVFMEAIHDKIKSSIPLTTLEYCRLFSLIVTGNLPYISSNAVLCYNTRTDYYQLHHLNCMEK